MRQIIGSVVGLMELTKKRFQFGLSEKLKIGRNISTLVFKELKRVLKPNGYVAFEVGEVRNGEIRLEENVIPVAEAAGLKPILVLINSQVFTKTSNCWGVDNLSKGTNTNRIVLLKN